MNILIIPEDFRKDQYMLKPLIQGMMRELGKPRVKVAVCQDPLLGGITEAMKWKKIEQILDEYKGMVDLYLLLVDRDGEEHRHLRLANIETKAVEKLRVLNKGRLLTEHAWQEIEVWMLAAVDDLPSTWSWGDIRQERDPKEVYYNKYVKLKKLTNDPGYGRTALGQIAGSKYRRVRQLCPEDVGNLENRILQHLQGENDNG